MVKRKIVWSHRADIKLFQILDFYADRNKSSAYSKKRYTKFNKSLSLTIKFPEMGTRTDFETVRGLIVDDFILFYEATPEQIIVHTIWDCRQNPDNLQIL
ncbi:hypothetical protein MASR2M47_23780 [Draconibacterium sp.]|jgi:plasmid stabilization system protein ParE